VCVLAVIEVIAGAVLEVVALKFSEGMLELPLSPPRLQLPVLFRGTETNQRSALLIFPFRELFVFEAVLLVAKSHAQEAIAATDAIAEEGARRAVLAVLTSDETVRVMHVHAVVAVLTMEIVKSVDAEEIILEAVPVVTIFAKIRVHDEVAILRGTGVVDVVGIDERPLNVERE
jgi:hypothetical protein